ncbi:MAG: tRNA uridine-5-carboxymethylaminomethyl(34) synthesis enzyme MnmG, partial [Clostridia bacterium]|nr:tRNA uridine-5-carboxymethylaminomethyl(34) synthesis enzyme MnmG [Clostridia bacterium]
LLLRQDNADFRLTEKGRKAGLVSDERYEIFLKRKELLAKCKEEMEEMRSPKITAEFLAARGESANGGISYKDMVKRGISANDIKEYFNAFDGIPQDVIETCETDAKYEGYLAKGIEQIEKAKKLENKLLPEDIDYLSIDGLRIEARQKLDKIRPVSLGQASRISGVNPADIAVLMVYLRK